MADSLDVSANNAPTANPFEEVGNGDEGASLASSSPAAAPNPFDSIPEAPQSSTTGAFGRAAVRGIVPAASGLAAAGAGAEAGALAGAGIGALFGGVGAAPGGLIGGALGFAGGVIAGGIGSYAAAKAQDYALSKAPESWVDKLGQDDRQQQLDQTAHPYASFLGGIAPYAVTMRPGGFARAALPDNATTFQRLAANPMTARVFGGAAMGGMELGNEAASHEDLDWRKVAISTGFGMVFNKPTKFGEAITELGARPVRGAFGIEGPTAPVTVAQAGDAKVMGPGVTEEVFQGAHEQDPASALTAQDDARTERSLAPAEPPAPDLHAVARQMEPELFEHYDGLSSRRDTFRKFIDQNNNPPPEATADLEAQHASLTERLGTIPTSGAGQNKPEARRVRAQIRDVQGQIDRIQAQRDTFAAGGGQDSVEAAIARQHLQDTDYRMRDLAPDVSAAYRRAADATSSGTYQPPTAPTAAEGAVPPPKFSSMTDMLAARGETSADGITERTNSTQNIPEIIPPQEDEPKSQALNAEQGTTATKPENNPDLSTDARTPEQQRAFIASDVARRLVAAGRPADEAEATGHLLAARYETRAARLGGVLGSAEDLYANHGATIRGPNQRRGGAPAGAPVDVRPPRPANAPRATNAPQSLLSVIRAAGGLKNDAGELDNLGRQFPGLVNNKAGLSLDRAREMVAELGYLGADSERAVSETAVDDLVNALHSHPTYSVRDEARVADKANRAAKKAYTDRVSSAHDELADFMRTHELDIDPELMDEASQRMVDHSEDPEMALERAAHDSYGTDQPHHGQEPFDDYPPGFFDGVSFSGEDPVGYGGGRDGGAQGDRGAARAQGDDARQDEGSSQRELAQDHQAQASSDKILAQGVRGKIRFSEGQRPVISLMADANASTFIHETGHQWLEELMSDAKHEAALDVLKDDAKTVRDWLGVDAASDIQTKHHEKFARGFEQYMREGIAPSPGLASVFSKFRNWLSTVYQTVKGLGAPINDDIRGVFDRLISTDPQRTVIAPEREGGPSLHDIHEADANETEPHEADAAHDRVEAETQRYIAEQPPEIANELAAATGPDRASPQPAREADGGAGAGATVDNDRGQSQPVAGSSGGGAQRGPLVSGDGAARGESGGAPGGGQRGPSADTGQPLAPSPSTLFGPVDNPLIDKAGNIRLDTLTTNEDVKQAIRDSAAANNDFIGDRRGVVTDGQVLELADALGMDAAKLQTRKIGQAFNAEQVVAARKLLIESATTVSDAMKKAATGTDKDVMAYAMAKDRHQMIQGQVAGITAEAGRALRAFRSLAGEETAQATDQFIKSATGKTLFQLREEAKLGATLDTPQQVSKFMDDAQKPTFGRMVLEYWINGLISGPATHTTYMMGNTILSIQKAGPETLAAAGIGAVRSALGREGEIVRPGEVGAQLRGAGAGFAPGLKAAVDAFRTGVTTQLPGEDMLYGQGSLPLQPGSELAQAAKLDESAGFHDVMASAVGAFRGGLDGIVSGASLLKAGGVEGASLLGTRASPLGSIPDITVRGVNVLPVGSVVRSPGRFIAAIHSFFRSVNYSMEKNAQAYRMAAGEGLSGDDLAARVGDLRDNPPEALMESARDVSTQLTLMGQGSQFVQALGKLTNTEIFGFPLLKFVDPFVHIAGNVMDQSIVQRTPLGLLAPEIRADLSGANGTIAQDKTAAKMLVGTALSVAFGGLAARGLVSGSGPDKPGERTIWQQAGNQAHSVRIGDMWYDVHRLGPIGMLMGISADMYEVAHLAGKGEMLTAAAALQHAYVQNIFDESFMKGPSDLIKAVDDPGRYGESYLKNFASSFVPFSVGMSQMARASDPYSRQARTVVDAIRAKVPGLSEGLYPRRDVWGEPTPNHDALGAAGLTAIYETQVSRDPVNGAMLRLGVYPATLEHKIRNVALTDQQYDDFSRIAGRMSKMRLDTIVSSPDYAQWPNQVQHDTIAEVIKQSREAARGILMMKYPQIPRDATAARIVKATSAGQPK